MVETKGMDISVLPQIENNDFAGNQEIKNERDVERYLIEPLLEKLEYTEEDWVRQMTLRMGRGEKVYPDYCIGAIEKRGEEKAKMIIEAKYKIINLHKDFSQARSYTLRLQVKKFILESLEGIWIFEPNSNGDYIFEKNHRFNWNELQNPDIFYNFK